MTQNDHFSAWRNTRNVARRRNHLMLFGCLLIMVLPILGFLTLDTASDDPHEPLAVNASEQLIGHSLGTTALQFGTEQLAVQDTEDIHYLTVQRTAPIPLDAPVFLTCEGSQAFVRTADDLSPSPVVKLPESISCPSSRL